MTREEFETLSRGDLRDMYDAMLDDVYPTVEIGDGRWDPSLALFRLDPLSYVQGFDDYVDSLEQELEDE